MAVLIGGTLTFFVFPRKDEELRMRAAFMAEDGDEDAARAGPAPAPPAPAAGTAG